MDIAELLAFSVKNKASDLHLSAGLPPMIRVDGDVRRINIPALDHKQVHALVYDIMSDKQRRDYEEFLEKLVNIYIGLKPLLCEKAYLTIIVKNVKKGGKIYPLAWDIARELGKTYTLKDEKIWVQDNQRLAPFGLGSAWVSNTFHHYCLQFRNE